MEMVLTIYSLVLQDIVYRGVYRKAEFTSSMEMVTKGINFYAIDLFTQLETRLK